MAMEKKKEIADTIRSLSQNLLKLSFPLAKRRKTEEMAADIAKIANDLLTIANDLEKTGYSNQIGFSLIAISQRLEVMNTHDLIAMSQRLISIKAQCVALNE